MLFEIPPAAWSQFVAFVGGGVVVGFSVMLVGFGVGTFARTVLHSTK